jgi:biopolymer transport protein ExbD
MIKKLIATGAITACAVLAAAHCGRAQEYLSGMKWQEPPVVKPGKTNADPPSDAIILFDGKDLSAWENGDNWTVKDGVATIGKGDIKTKQSFGDCQLHIEWSAPKPAKGHGQGRGNSGVFLQDHYELQVLDSYHDKTYFDGQASAIYKQHPPMVNAMRPPGEWNTYDVVWSGPQFNDGGSLKSPAYITVLHNGVLTQNHFALEGATPFTEVPHYEKHGKLPIHLQDHGNPVRYRNIWLREIKPIEGKRERGPYFHDHASGKDTPISMSVKVDVPETTSIETESGLPLVFALKRNESGKVTLYLNENPIDEAAVRKIFGGRKLNKDQAVSLSADRGIAYGEVMKVVDLLESVGFEKLALDTRHVEPSENKKQ